MAVNRDIAQRCVDLLNEIIALDCDAATRLIAARVPCNESLAQHPTVQVGPCHDCPDDLDRVGLVGVLNGLAGTYDGGPRGGWGAVAVAYEDGLVTGAVLLENEAEGHSS